MTGGLPPWPRRAALAVWLGLIAGIVAAFWALFSFDPQAGVMRATTGVEGALFDPSGEDPRLIGVLAFWMCLTRRGRLAAAWRAGASEPALAAVLLAGALAVQAWSAHVDAPDLQTHALQLLLLGGGALLGGREGLRVVRLPVLFLFLAMPVPAALLNAALLPLQMATVQACTAVLASVGMDAWAFGDQILTPRGIFHVIETCSGVRLVQTLLMAAVVYAELFGRGASRTCVLVALAPVVGLVVNLARILSIIFNPYASISSVHTTQGVAMVVIGVLALAAIDRGLEWARPSPTRAPGQGEPLLQIRPDLRLAAICAVVLGLVAIQAWVPRFDGNSSGPQLEQLPSRLAGRSATFRSPDLVFLGSVHFSYRIHRVYSPDAPDAPATSRGPREVLLFVGEDDHLNRRGSMLSGKTAYPGRAWTRLGSRPAALADGTPVEVGLFASPESKQVVVHWREGFRSLLVEALRGWSGVDRSRFRRSEEALVWRISAEIDDASQIDRTEAELLRFALEARNAWRGVQANVRTGK